MPRPSMPAAFQQLQEVAVAAADVEHLRAALDHFRDQQMIAAILSGVRRDRAAQRQDRLLQGGHVSCPSC